MPRRRIEVIIEIALSLPHGAEAAIRSWVSVDPHVLTVQREVDQQRFDILYDSALEIVKNDRQAAVYAAWAVYVFVGYEQAMLPREPGTFAWISTQMLDALESVASPACRHGEFPGRSEGHGHPCRGRARRARLRGAAGASLRRHLLPGDPGCARPLHHREHQPVGPDPGRRGGHRWAVGGQPVRRLRGTSRRVRPRTPTPRRVEVLQASGQIVQAAVIPVAVLAAAGIGLLQTYTAVWVAMWAIVGELAVIALLAVRKAQLNWWQRLFTIIGLASVGALVLVIKMLAH